MTKDKKIFSNLKSVYFIRTDLIPLEELCRNEIFAWKANMC